MNGASFACRARMILYVNKMRRNKAKEFSKRNGSGGRLGVRRGWETQGMREREREMCYRVSATYEITVKFSYQLYYIRNEAAFSQKRMYDEIYASQNDCMRFVLTPWMWQSKKWVAERVSKMCEEGR